MRSFLRQYSPPSFICASILEVGLGSFEVLLSLLDLVLLAIYLGLQVLHLLLKVLWHGTLMVT